MNDDTNKDFGIELIKRYGTDRFYHSCRRTESGDYGSYRAVFIYLYLNNDADKHSCNNFFTSIGLKDCVWPWISEDSTQSQIDFIKKHFEIDPRTEMCRIAYGLCRYFKEFGLRTHKLPDHIHARMILGEKNKWVVDYLKFLEEYIK